jgi:hypothetical protein
MNSRRDRVSAYGSAKAICDSLQYTMSMKIARYLLLVSCVALVPLSGQAAASQAPASQGTAMSASAAPDLALSELLVQVQATAQKSDQDVARLRIDKWKADSASKQQAETTANSIRRNLMNAVPDLVQRVQASPGSLNANFRLYRNLNVLYETFSALADCASAFSSSDQYQPLSSDLNLLDQLRRQIAERVDLLAGNNDAELARLRARLGNAKNGAKPGSTKVVVDDDQPKPKKKLKPAQQQSQQ